jgi:beta-ribofuranosylaminobenzene 5'-phosphate synthase
MDTPKATVSLTKNMGTRFRCIDKATEVWANEVFADLAAGHAFEIDLHVPYSAHSGLGTTTAVRFAVLKCLQALEPPPQPKPHHEYKIGLASGVGLLAYTFGGLVVDGGFPFLAGQSIARHELSRNTNAPLVARAAFPPEWRVILAVPVDDLGVSGEEEFQFFEQHVPIAVECSKSIAFDILMALLPSLHESNFQIFISSMKSITSSGFKSFEEALLNPRGRDALNEMRDHFGFAAVSSLGPALYSFSNCAYPTLPSIPGYEIFCAPPQNDSISASRAESVF